MNFSSKCRNNTTAYLCTETSAWYWVVCAVTVFSDKITNDLLLYSNKSWEDFVLLVFIMKEKQSVDSREEQSEIKNVLLAQPVQILPDISSFTAYPRWDVPIGVEAGDGGLPVAVQVLRLLQEDVVEDAGDVDGDVVLYGLEHRHVGAHAGQQLAGLGYLLGGLVVHGHPHYRPAES